MTRTPKHTNHRILYPVLFFVISTVSILTPQARESITSQTKLTPEERSWLDTHQKSLVLCYNPNMPPIEFSAKDTSFSGVSADIIALVERQLGITFIKKVSNYGSDRFKELSDGTCAIAPAIAYTYERDSTIFFTAPYLNTPVVIVTKKPVQDELTLATMDGLRVVVTSKYLHDNYLRDQAWGQFDVRLVHTVAEGCYLLETERVDAYIENEALAIYYINKNALKKISIRGNTHFHHLRCIGISRQYPILFSAVNKAFNAIPGSEIDAIVKKWIPHERQRRLPPETARILRIVAISAAILICCLTVIVILLKQHLRIKITNLEKVKKEILEQSELLRLATETNQAGIWDAYPLQNTITLSAQWKANLGYEAKITTLSLDTLHQMIHPEDVVNVIKNATAYINSGGKDHMETEFRLRKADGTWCWVVSKGKCVEFNEEGIPTRIIGMDINIDYLKQAYIALQQSESRFRAIFDNAPYSIVISDFEDSRIIDANKTFLNSRGISKNQLSSLKTDDLVFDCSSGTQNVIERLKSDGEVHNIEGQMHQADGSIRYILFSCARVEITGRQLVIATTVDITEKKMAEQALIKSEAKFRALFEMAPIPLVRMTKEGVVLEVNQRFTKTLGYTAKDFTAPDKWATTAYPNPAYRAEVMSIWQSALDDIAKGKADPDPVEFHITCKNNAEMNMTLLAKCIDDFVLISFFDITDRKKNEVERQLLQEQLYQSQKMEAIGTLAGGVAHDFNNLIGAIMGYTELTMEEMAEDDPFRKNLREIFDIARRSADLTHQLLAFARKQAIVPIHLDLNHVIENTLKMLYRLIGENISLAWLPCKKSICQIKMDPSQIDQIIANLCVNARDAITKGFGKITIETDVVYFDKDYCDEHINFTPGHFALLAVSDDGCGMDKETVSHIFEPFFTTKGLGKGTGLGLATIYGIVKQNNGFINVYSEPGNGTVFRIYIPLDIPIDDTVVQSGQNKPQRGHGETVLLIEDDPTLLDTTGEMLERLGYSILSSDKPSDAIRIVRETTRPIHILLTDIIMPEMNGKDLAEQLLAIRPTIKPLFMSGYTSNVIVNKDIIDKGYRFIQKPFTMYDLAKKIREVLEGSVPEPIQQTL